MKMNKCPLHKDFIGYRLGKIAKKCKFCISLYENNKTYGIKETRKKVYNIKYPAEYYINKWMPTIIKFSNKYKNTICGSEDLINEGILSVIKSLAEYDPLRAKNKNSINAFIKKCLYNAIVKESFQNSFPVNVPSGSINLINQKKLKSNGLVTRIYGETFNIDNIIDIRDIINKFDENGIAWEKFIEEKTIKEIANEKQISYGKINVITKRVKRQIEKLMK